MCVNEDYHLFSCKTMQSAKVLEENTASIYMAQGVRILEGSSLQLQLATFITRHSSYSFDANKLLSTNRTLMV